MYNIYGVELFIGIYKRGTSGLYGTWSAAALDTQLTHSAVAVICIVYIILYIINACVCVCRYKRRTTR